MAHVYYMFGILDMDNEARSSNHEGNSYIQNKNAYIGKSMMSFKL